MKRAGVVSAALSLLMPVVVNAQVTITVEGILYLVEQPDDFGGVTACDSLGCFSTNQDSVLETGTWFGGRGAIRYRSVSLEVEGVLGQLEAEGRSRRHVDPRVNIVRLQVHSGDWLSFGPAMDTWRSDRFVENVTHDVILRRFGVSGQISGGLGFEGLRGVFMAGAYPFIQLRGLPDPRRASDFPSRIGRVEPLLNEGSHSNTRFTVELSYAPPSVPLTFRMGFRSERFLDAESDDASENQLRGLYIATGIRWPSR